MSENAEAAPYYVQLKEALAQPGCAFCRLLTNAADSYIDSILWEMVNDPRTREELNAARGYCHQHAWLMAREGSALGVAIILNDIIQTELNVLKNRKSGAAASLGKFLPSLDISRVQPEMVKLANVLGPQSTCPACVKLESTQKHLVNALAKYVGSDTDSLAEDYRASAGLCLPHFRLALTAKASKAELNALVDAQRSVWMRLRVDLDEFIRKNDYRFRSEKFGDEADSWLRALEAVSGAPPKNSSNRSLL